MPTSPAMSLTTIAVFVTLLGLVALSLEANPSDPRFFLQRGSTGQGKMSTPSSVVTSVPVAASSYERNFLALPLGTRPKGKALFIPRSNWFFPSFDAQDSDEENNSGSEELNADVGLSYKFGNYKRVGDSSVRGWMPSFNPIGTKTEKLNGSPESHQATENRIHRLNYNFFKLMG